MKKIVIKEFGDKDDAIEYWKNKTPEERLDAVELLREQYYVIQGLRSVPRINRYVNVIER
jgi:hypothetical protein